MQAQGQFVLCSKLQANLGYIGRPGCLEGGQGDISEFPINCLAEVEREQNETKEARNRTISLQDGYGMSEHYYLTLQFYQPVRVENII